MSIDRTSLKQLIRVHVLEESRKGKYSLNYELADIATSGSSAFKPNTNQGAVKGRKPHTRIAASPEAVKKMAGTIQKIKAAGGFTSIYSDQALFAEFIESFQKTLGNPPITIIGTSGSPGEYSDTFPALEVEFKLASGESARGTLVPTFASARVAKGKVYQDATAKIVDNALEKMGITNSNIQTAKPGSQVADVQVSAQDAAGNPLAFNLEVKGPGGKFFDKTVQRGMKSQKPEIQMIDNIAAAIAKSKGYNATNLEDYIDQLRKNGINNVGYIGDPGISQRSGSLPKEHFSTPITPEILAAIKNHWASGGDTYFVVADGTTSYMWYTGYPAASGPANPLKMPDGKSPIPEFSMKSIEGGIELSTYGSASAGRLRVALKAKFNLQSSAPLTESLSPNNNILIREYVRSIL